jgi:hypothetical protein
MTEKKAETEKAEKPKAEPKPKSGLVIIRDAHGVDTEVVVHPGDTFIVTVPADQVQVERQ